MTLTEIYSELKKKEVTIHTKYSYTAKKTNNVSKMMSLGRIWLNILLPEDYKLIDEPVDGKKLGKILSDLYKTIPPKEMMALVVKINREAAKINMISPIGVEADSLILSPEIKKLKKELLEDIKYDNPVDFLNALLKVSLEKSKEDEKNNLGVQKIIKSKAKGSINDALLSTLIISRGSVTDIEGNISEPITASLNDGLNVSEYYAAAGEGRSILYVKSKSAAEPGYLSRRTVFSLSDIQLDTNDCGTTKYLKLKILPSMSTKINGRNYFSEETQQIENIEDGSKLIGQTILLRSPIFCKSEIGICHVCFGKLSESIRSRHVGVAAGAMMFDIGVTVAMKSRHNAVQFKTIKTDFINNLSRE